MNVWKPPNGSFREGLAELRIDISWDPLRSHSERAFRARMRQDRGETSLGTMVLFTVVLAVTATAVAILFNASAEVQEKGQRVGSESASSMRVTLALESVVGRRDSGTSPGLDDLDIYVAFPAGSPPVNLNTTKVILSNETSFHTHNHTNSATPGTGQFNVSAILDADNSVKGGSPTLTGGDRIRFNVRLAAAGNQRFQPQDTISVAIVPEPGARLRFVFDTPVTFGTATVIELAYP